MNILLAPDKFKGTLSAMDFCLNCAEAASAFDPDVTPVKLPLSDGGEGFCDVVAQFSTMVWRETSVSDPLFRKINARYLLNKDRTEAFIEMARSSGIGLLSEGERNCMYTTSYGLGELILDAVKQNVRKIYVGLGGSATNEAGMGMATALGYRFLDKHDNEVIPVGRNLRNVVRIVEPGNNFLRNVRFITLTDVSNPLYGPDGAAMVYAGQKGASMEETELLDKGLAHLSDIIKRDLGMEISQLPGAGAAGGLGAGCKAFLNAELRSGSDFMLSYSKFNDYLDDSGLIITGEGSFDAQSSHGKLPFKVASVAKDAGVPVALIAGSIKENIAKTGIFNSYVDLSRLAGSQEEAMIHAGTWVQNATHKILSTFKQKLWTN